MNNLLKNVMGIKNKDAYVIPLYEWTNAGAKAWQTFLAKNPKIKKGTEEYNTAFKDMMKRDKAGEFEKEADAKAAAHDADRKAAQQKAKDLDDKKADATKERNKAKYAASKATKAKKEADRQDELARSSDTATDEEKTAARERMQQTKSDSNQANAVRNEKEHELKAAEKDIEDFRNSRNKKASDEKEDEVTLDKDIEKDQEKRKSDEEKDLAYKSGYADSEAKYQRQGPATIEDITDAIKDLLDKGTIGDKITPATFYDNFKNIMIGLSNIMNVTLDVDNGEVPKKEEPKEEPKEEATEEGAK